MIFGILIPILLLAAIVIGVRRVSTGSISEANRAYFLRRFFQYSLLFALLVISNIGLSGLLTRLLEVGQSLATDNAALARDVTFAVVGVPLLAGIAIWTRNTITKDPKETSSFAWGMFTTVALTTSLVVSMIAVHDFLNWAADFRDDGREPAARAIVWCASWVALWVIKSNYCNKEQIQSSHISGSLIGLGTTVAGFVAVITALIQNAFGFDDQALVSQGTDPTLKGLITCAVGLPVLYLYWNRGAMRSQRNTFWLAYVLLFGVGASLVATIASASTALYQTLVWYLGNPDSTDSKIHFSATPENVAYVLVGLTVWFYHKSVLTEELRVERNEVNRIYEYLISGIALIAAGTGFGILIVALIESVTGTELITSGGAANTLLSSITLLAVGTPVWWYFWNRIQTYAHANPTVEVPTPTRRTYLFLLFGIGGVAAIVSLLTGVYYLFSDIFEGVFGTDTLRNMRYPIGILLTTGTLAAYHWSVYGAEREHMALFKFRARSIVMVGPKDEELVEEISKRTGDRVQAWVQVDIDGRVWPKDEVLALIEKPGDEDLLIMMNGAGLEAIPIART